VIKKAIVAAGVAGFILIHLTAPPEGLTQEAWRAIAVFLLALSLWSTTALPLAVTSLLTLALLPICGVLPSSKAFALFGNRSVFFILGAFILAAAMMKTGLSRRLALFLLHRFDRSPNILLLGIMLSAAFLSCWMPEHAVAAMMFPLVLEIAHSLDLKPLKTAYGKSLFLSMAWGAIIGGVATFLGGARNPLAVGMLQETYGQTIGFFEWMKAVVPVVVVMLGVGHVLLRVFFPLDVKDVSGARRELGQALADTGAMSATEKKVGLVMLLTISAWIFISRSVGLAEIGILAAVLLFVIKAVTWKDVEGYVNWGVILMYGGAIALGEALAETQAAAWFAQVVVAQIHLSPLAVVALISALTLLLTEAISNAAAVAIMLPLGFGLGETLHINPALMVFMVAVPSGLAFVLPIGTPPNAIAFSSGYYRVEDVIKPGIIMVIISWLLFNLAVRYYWPLIGLTLWVKL
jgi:sodium-dependent dicarboxylate transporter 2/3/5